MDAQTTIATPLEVLRFWFEELDQEAWFVKSEETDRTITERFRDTHLALARGIGPEWRQSPEARLAAIIVLDQFPRNMYRDTPLAFSTDGLALREARAMVDGGHDAGIDAQRRVFVYMPFEHSENLADQNRAVELISQLGDETYTDYAQRHRDVIAKYGRFPHRNAILGRNSTPSEESYLAKPGAGF